MIAERKGTIGAGDIAKVLKTSRTNATQSLRLLRNAGYIVPEKNGAGFFYQISEVLKRDAELVREVICYLFGSGMTEHKETKIESAYSPVADNPDPIFDTEANPSQKMIDSLSTTHHFRIVQLLDKGKGADGVFALARLVPISQPLTSQRLAALVMQKYADKQRDWGKVFYRLTHSFYRDLHSLHDELSKIQNYEKKSHK